MSHVNQKGEEIVQTQLFTGVDDWSDITIPEVHTAIGLILDHIGCSIIRTTNTKSGDTELQILRGK